MFDHPLGGTPERDTLAVEPDPWAEAMHGAPTPDPVSADARNAAI
jgi:hypothetical protein